MGLRVRSRRLPRAQAEVRELAWFRVRARARARIRVRVRVTVRLGRGLGGGARLISYRALLGLLGGGGGSASMTPGQHGRRPIAAAPTARPLGAPG